MSSLLSCALPCAECSCWCDCGVVQPDERLEVMYGNIKHAIFQPADNEMITLIHFHLHNPIMVGKKKTKDVQFFAEVMDNSQAVGGSRRSAYDPDEIEEEQRERERRNRINHEFESFVRAVQGQWEKDPVASKLDLEFDVPFRELGFHGVPHKSATFLVPSVNCLLELIEQPFFVVTLNEVRCTPRPCRLPPFPTPWRS